MQSRRLRLAHRWILIPDAGISESLVREFIRPAVRAVPSSMARRLGPSRISLLEQVAADVTSRWTTAGDAAQAATGRRENVDSGFVERVSMELSGIRSIAPV
jgi:hypothetical protein